MNLTELKAEAEFIEKGAALEHARWSRWMEYMLDCSIQSGDDDLGIRTCAWPKAQFETWLRQMETSYEDLTEKEKESDRREVREYLPFIHQREEAAFEAGYKTALLEVIEVAEGMLGATVEGNDTEDYKQGLLKGFNTALSEIITKLKDKQK